MTLEARLDELERRLAELEAEWSRPDVATDPERSRSLGREQAQVGPIVENYRRLRQVREQLAGARSDEFPTRRDRWAAASAQVSSLEPGDTRGSTRTRESLSATSLRTTPST